VAQVAGNSVSVSIDLQTSDDDETSRRNLSHVLTFPKDYGTSSYHSHWDLGFVDVEGRSLAFRNLAQDLGLDNNFLQDLFRS
jgi:hypothetical protein